MAPGHIDAASGSVATPAEQLRAEARARPALAAVGVLIAFRHVGSSSSIEPFVPYVHYTR